MPPLGSSCHVECDLPLPPYCPTTLRAALNRPNAIIFAVHHVCGLCGRLTSILVGTKCSTNTTMSSSLGSPGLFACSFWSPKVIPVATHCLPWSLPQLCVYESGATQASHCISQCSLPLATEPASEMLLSQGSQRPVTNKVGLYLGICLALKI